MPASSRGSLRLLGVVSAGVGCLLLAAPLAAMPPQAALTVIKEGKLDLIKLYVAKLSSGATIQVVVRPFAADAANLGSGGPGFKQDERDQAVQFQKSAPGLLAAALVERLKKTGAFSSIAILEASAPIPPQALVIDGRFVTMDPGDRGKRRWVGMGSGKTTVAVEGVVKDAAGQLLAEFSQERFGTSNRGTPDLLTSDAKSIGEDIANFLDAWARGKRLN